MVTIENDTVLERRLVRLEGDAANLSFTTDARWTPNVWCAVTVVRPVEPAAVWSVPRAFGAAPLAVRPAGRRLTVEVAAPETVRPLGPLPVTLTVRDDTGAPVADAELTLAAVDEAILMLTAFPLPDPWAYFLRLRFPGVAHHDLFARLLPVLSDALAGTPLKAGADGPGDALRARRLNPIMGRRFIPTALWRDGLRTDAEGRATVTLDLPEFTGRLRLAAVAFDARRAGAQRRDVTVKRPLTVQSSLPRFLAPGDACDAVVSIFNDTGAEADVAVAWRAEGPAAVESPAATIHPAHRRGDAMGRARPRPGRRRPGAADPSRRGRRGAARGDHRTAGAADAAAGRPPADGPARRRRDRRVHPPPGGIPGAAHLELRAGGSPALEWGAGLDYLLRYPYGCLEQTASGVLPLLRLLPLWKAEGPAASAPGDPEGLIRAGVLRHVRHAAGRRRLRALAAVRRADRLDLHLRHARPRRDAARGA
jgi:alpha-2-macroglobulin